MTSQSTLNSECAVSAPETLISKLAARHAELATLNAVVPFTYTPNVALAERRVWWAHVRKTDAENRLARLVKGTVKYGNLCRKLYGQDTVPTDNPWVSLFEVGTLAYVEDYDPHAERYALISCKVIKVTDDDVMVKFTSVRGGHRVGETLTTAHRDVIPRSRVERPKSRDYVINAGWIWAQN